MNRHDIEDLKLRNDEAKARLELKILNLCHTFIDIIEKSLNKKTTKQKVFQPSFGIKNFDKIIQKK